MVIEFLKRLFSFVWQKHTLILKNKIIVAVDAKMVVGSKLLF